MKITLTIDGDLYHAATQLAAETHRTLDQVVEDGLRQLLAKQEGGQVPDVVPFVLTTPLNDAFIRKARNDGRA